MRNNTLEFHIIYDKKTGKTSGTLYYDRYSMNYIRQTGAKVQDPYNEEDYIQAHEGYKCTNLSRYKVQFFPPEINSINALSKYLENRFDLDLDLELNYSELISAIEIEGLKQTLRKQFKLDQNTEILTYIFDELGSDFFYQQSNNEYFFGAAFFNNRFFLFREFLDKKLQLLECKPAREITTEEEFYDFTGDCSFEIERSDYLFAEGINLCENAAILIDNKKLFIQKEEKPVIELDMNYKDTLVESNRGPVDPVIDDLICKALETVAFQEYKHFTRKGIGFEYRCVDGLKIQHNIQGRQKIDLTKRKLQFFKKQQLKQQLNHIQDAENDMVFQDTRLHD